MSCDLVERPQTDPVVVEVAGTGGEIVDRRYPEYVLASSKSTPCLRHQRNDVVAVWPGLRIQVVVGDLCRQSVSSMQVV